ncbi:DUF1573 domain-containing protein [Candidatus Nomurabacteria bacterium]|nr:DUF1573 domain-containing protein [Candidatus Nomurabacteria bacterium]
MDKKTIISLIIIILGVAGLVWWSKSVDSKSLSATETKSHPARIASDTSVLTAEETFYDFGRISMKDGNVSKIFKVTNRGNTDVNLTNVSTSCMCTAAYILRDDGSKLGPFGMPGHGGTGGMPGHGNSKAGEIITAGESRNIEVVYDPNAHGPAGVGLIDRFIYLEDENGNKLELEIKASVMP